MPTPRLLRRLRRWLYDHGVWVHAQNLDDDGRGSMWRHGRAWLRLSRGNAETREGYEELLEIEPSWNFEPRATAGLVLDVGGGDSNCDVMLHLDHPLAHLFLTLSSRRFRPLLARILPGHWYDLSRLPEPYRADERHWMTEEAELSLRWHHGGLWWSLWMPTNEWHSTDPKWRRGSFHPVDFLLGRYVYVSDELETEPVEVPMPEKTYQATVVLTRDVWKRPRWPVAQVARRATISVEGGVPHPGKGENSWDCGQDATYSLTCRARTVEDAVGELVKSVMNSRRRYGGRNWRPAEVAS